LDFPALLKAIAMDCFCGFPDRISVAMFFDVVVFELPFFKGIINPFVFYVNRFYNVGFGKTLTGILTLVLGDTVSVSSTTSGA
jgi:hypothetical protein